MTVSFNGKRLVELSDEELEAERRRRRRARGHADATPERPRDRFASLRERWRKEKEKEREDEPERVLEKAYAALELEEGASLSEVRRQYRALMRRYDPEKHEGDAEKREAAEALARGLTRAYQTLLGHLS
jgi:DnaJ-class molecular chaperone